MSWLMVPEVAAAAQGTGRTLNLSTRLLLWLGEYLLHWSGYLEVPALGLAIGFGL